ncbi:hypothetical protein [Ovoidimarina sediminis]|nr:hypothetical protein [Rhodophyticola sp. MJ-SS7]MDU8945881.1 hypothetical protein [Rhodophyticola sp. MJ-SS7]
MSLGDRFEVLMYRFSAMEISAPILLFFGFSLLVAFYWLIWGK